MENKITVGSLSANISQATGKSKKLSEDFLKEFFKLASEVLQDGDSLRIKGFGTFKIVEMDTRMGVNVNTGEKQEIEAFKKVSFSPSKELASFINAPFEEFESVELDDEMPEDIFEDENLEEEEEALSDESNVSKERLEEGSDEEASDDIITYEAYNDIEEKAKEKSSEEKGKEKSTEEIVKEGSPEEKAKEESPEETVKQAANEASPVETVEKQVVVPVYEDYEQPSKSRFGLGFLLGAISTFALCAVIFMLGCFFDWWPVNFGNLRNLGSIENKELVTEIPETDTPSVENIEEAAPVYDTVSTTRYLTTIAREHYGDFNFWPYIYLENENILGHPDRITPGTQVVVPPLSKYGVDTSNKEDVAKAKAKAQEIYARFK